MYLYKKGNISKLSVGSMNREAMDSYLCCVLERLSGFQWAVNTPVTKRTRKGK